jgi:hypothetical protein
MKSKLLAGTAICALLGLGTAAHANELIATIIGAYDAECSSTCISGNPNITNYASNGGGGFDTPSLFILNPTGSAFTNVQLVLTGYQDAAGGSSPSVYTPGAPDPATLTVTLPSIGANTVYQLIWGGGAVTTSGAHGINLLAGDYDDSQGNAAGTGASDAAGHHCGTLDTGNSSICAFVGNFDVAFSATWDGGPISSNFSPNPSQDGGNAQGSFVGWEGIDVDGLSETAPDSHLSSFPGTLANIFTGTNQNGGTPVPEPGTLSLIAGGLGALATARRRRKTKQA